MRNTTTLYARKILTICANMAIPLNDLKYPGSHAKPNILLSEILAEN